MKTFVKAISNAFINVNDEIFYFNFNYKNLIRYDLYWDLDFEQLQDDQRAPSLAIWEPEDQAGEIVFQGTQEEYDEYIQPLVDLWEAEKQRQANDQVLQKSLLLKKYDNVVTAYQSRINLAQINQDTELENQLVQEMKSYDPAADTQSLETLQHYCKSCGHDLDEFNMCTNENCKRYDLQQQIVQAAIEQEAEKQKELEAQNQEQEQAETEDTNKSE